MTTLIAQTAHTEVSEDPNFVNPETGARNRFYVNSLTTGELLLSLQFHTGPIHNGANGVFMEDLLECIIARLEGFQAGPFACAENALALEHAKHSLAALDSRTGRIRIEQISSQS